MTEPQPQPCPDCGHLNAPGSEMCAKCHFPLVELEAQPRSAGMPAPPGAPPAAPPPAAATAPANEPPPATTDASGARPAVPRASLRPIRPRPPRPQNSMVLSLWLGFGTLASLALVLVAFDGYRKSNIVPVEGSNAEQQKQVNAIRAELARDSTNLEARVALADILFDTGNWADAAVQYRSAIRQDSSLVSAIVDLGVCAYNMSDPDEAERLFDLALARDPHHPFALFNLGIVHERREQTEEALRYFHLALQSGPPENMKGPLMEAMQRVAKATGRDPKPLEAK